ncbi:MAG: beta-ketoacyl-ACP synthase II [Saprospiraceae bacterium]|nr:beta-ketoacyl-ACP synthase II [Saprospiraceae bacterium]
MRRVVVTGIGALTPIGNNVGAYKDGLQKGISGANLITHFDATLFKTKFACEIKNLDISGTLDSKDAKRMDLYTQYAMITAHEAMVDSGLDLEKEDLDRIGVIYGSGIGGLGTLEKEIEDFARGNGTPRFNPFMIPKMISDIAAGQISMRYGLRGINYATVSACATSSHAVINAFDYIRLNKADIIVSGGSEATVTHAGIGGFNAMKALSENNDNYLTASRPFDKERDGFVLGEGSGTLILEEYEHAKRRGAKIYAEVIGTGMTADAYHLTAPHPEGISVEKVMRIALAEAGVSTNEVDYINVHGTSTPLGDIAELKAIQKTFGADAYGINISSTKSMTGHLLGAAGAIESIAGLLAIKEGFIPPSINHSVADPDIDPKLNLTLNEPQQRDVKIVLSNTFGFGGHNTSIIFKKI